MIVCASKGGVITHNLFSSYYWSTAPYITSTEEWISWSSWVSENNYNSSVPITVSTTVTSTTTTTLGFSGTGEMKVAISASAEYSKSYSTSITQGATVPGWTFWGRRPYIEFNKEYWTGYYTEKYYDLARGGWTYYTKREDGVNKVLQNAATEYRTYTNYSKTYSTPPSLPTGQPQV